MIEHPILDPSARCAGCWHDRKGSCELAFAGYPNRGRRCASWLYCGQPPAVAQPDPADSGMLENDPPAQGWWGRLWDRVLGGGV